MVDQSTIVIIEDDEVLGQMLALNLREEGYLAINARRGLEGLRAVFENKPHLVILDLMMPGMDGWEVMCRLRELSDVPILILTAKNQLKDRLRGLSQGADDYICKPFDLSELLLRVKAVLRRVATKETMQRPTLFHDGYLTIDLATFQVKREGEPVRLTRKEYRLLSCFVRNKGHLLTPEYLVSEVWGRECIDSTHYVRGYIARLRCKLEKDPRHPKYIITERGLGYRFTGSSP
jgi:two-component system KDP operon response regulator KdpE